MSTDRSKGNMTGSDQVREDLRSFRRNNFMKAGTFGVVLQCLGLLWLLSAAGFVIPWYSVFPVTIMIAGGIFIVRAIIRGRERIGRGAFIDGRNHQGN